VKMDTKKIVSSPSVKTSPTRELRRRREKRWYELLNLDLLLTVLHRTFLHPFVAWVAVLCLRATVTPVTDRVFIATTVYAVFLTFLALAKVLNDRLAYGIPRDVVGLDEEVVVVTGGASGLGKLIAQIYGMRGANVAVLDVKGFADVDGWDGLTNVEYYQCDIVNRSQVEASARRIVEDVGALSISLEIVMFIYS
jgi:short chain dehydrogenase